MHQTVCFSDLKCHETFYDVLSIPQSYKYITKERTAFHKLPSSSFSSGNNTVLQSNVLRRKCHKNKLSLKLNQTLWQLVLSIQLMSPVRDMTQPHRMLQGGSHTLDDQKIQQNKISSLSISSVFIECHQDEEKHIPPCCNQCFVRFWTFPLFDLICHFPADERFN